MDEEVAKTVEETEKEIAEEEQLKKVVEEEIAKESEEQGFVINDIPQIFNDEGMLECTCDYTATILDEVIKVVCKYKVGDVAITRRLCSETQGEKNEAPAIFFTGEDVIVRFRVAPIDKYGNNGKKWLTKEEHQEISSNMRKE